MLVVLKYFHSIRNTLKKSKGNSCKSEILLASDHKSFTETSDKMLDQNETKYFFHFKDLFLFRIFTIY